MCPAVQLVVCSEFLTRKVFVSSSASIPTEPCHVFAAGSVLCPFLEDHKEDILCGPVWLASGLDLSGHAGMLSLTSPKLVKGSVDVCLDCEPSWLPPAG